MPQFESDLMMTIIVASTAFAGLTGMVIGQIITSRAQGRWGNARQFLITSCGLGVVVVLLAILWFLAFENNDIAGWIIALIFLFQMSLFWVAAGSFWAGEPR